MTEPALVAPYDPDADLCEDMGCVFFVKQEHCLGGDECPRLDAERMRLGSIYMIQPDGIEADFVTLLSRPRGR